jgi:glucan biosynthesis protein C
MTHPAPQATAPPTTRSRLLYVDNLRTALTALVVIHHAAVTYSNIPMWYYTEPATDPSGALLDRLLMIDQAFFMGAFFLIAGLFVPGSLDRKGGRRFLRDRLLRLGVPLLLFLLVLRPLATYPLWQQVAAQYGAELPYWLFYLASWDPGPMWFVEVLLVFSAVYVLCRRLAVGKGQSAPERPRAAGRAPGAPAIIGFATGLALATYLWRIVVPIGSHVPVLGLPTLAYLPQYAAMFTIGLLAARRGWLEGISKTTGRIGLAAAAIAAIALVLVFGSTGDTFLGHGTWQSLVMATCESALAVGIILGLVVLFRDRFNHQGRRRRFLSTHAYTVYITHPIVLVALGVALSGVPAPAVAKFALLAILAVPLCWTTAFLARAIPGARNVL